MKKQFFSLMLGAALLVSTTVGAFAAVTSFSDVKSGNWAAPYINKLVERGGINGYNDGTFKPQNAMTAAEFVKTVTAIINIGEIEKTEGDKHWASGYMWYAENIFGIVPEGMFEREDWDKPITREKMGVIMELAAEKFYEEEILTDEAKLAEAKAGIKDYSSVCDYCKDYIVQAVARGLITGYENGNFEPQKTATRAEAATMITRLIEPAYRVVEKEAGVVREGTDLTDIFPQDIAEWVGALGLIKRYAVLENGDKFNLKYLYSNDENFYVEYKLYGDVITLDKNMQSIDVSDPTNDWGTEANPGVQKQAFNGRLQDTAYFIFSDLRGDDCVAYLVPNTLTE